MPTTPNMGLLLPDVNVTPGPLWASEINNAQGVIDSHDHTPGKGVKITPAGMAISSDLDFLNNDAINLRTVRYTQGTPFVPVSSDLGCQYVSNNELYYRDTLGNVIQLTSGGFINVGAGSPITIRDNSFTLQYFADITRQARFDLTGLPVGTSIYQLPNASGRLVALNSIDTLTNKTFDTTNVIVNSASGISFGSPGNIFYCTLKGAAVGSISYTLNLPATDSSSVVGALVSNGSGTLTFQNVRVTTSTPQTNTINIVMTNTMNRTQFFNNTALTPLTITMPLGVLGDTWEFYNQGTVLASSMTINASGGGLIDFLLPNSVIKLICVTAGGSLPSAWKVIEATSGWIPFTNSGNSTGFTPTTTEIYFRRLGGSMMMRGNYNISAASLLGVAIGLPTINGVSLVFGTNNPVTSPISICGQASTTTGAFYSLFINTGSFTDRVYAGGNGTTSQLVAAPAAAFTVTISFQTIWMSISQFGGF